MRGARAGAPVPRRARAPSSGPRRTSARRSDVKALATFTQTGETAQRLAALHPRQPLLAFTVDARVRSQLALSWGVETFLVPSVRAHRRHGGAGRLLAAVDRPAEGRRPRRRRRRQPAEHGRARPTSSACTKSAPTRERRRSATARPPSLLAVLDLEEREQRRLRRADPEHRAAADLRRPGRRPGARWPRAGRSPPTGRCTRCTPTSCGPATRRGDPLRRRPDPRRPLVHAPAGWSPGSSARARRSRSSP